jgi:hypothetical protein
MGLVIVLDIRTVLVSKGLVMDSVLPPVVGGAAVCRAVVTPLAELNAVAYNRIRPRR